MMKKIWFWIFLLQTTYLSAQTKIDSLLLGLHHHVSVETLQMRGSATISNQGVSFSTPIDGCLAVGYRLHVGFTKKTALALGISLGGMNQENVQYNLSKTYFNLSRDFSIENKQGNLFYRFSLDYVFRYPLSKRLLFESQAGINMTGLAFLLDYNTTSNNAQNNNVFVQSKGRGEQLKSPLGLQIGSSLALLLSNNNFIRLGFCYYHAPHSVYQSEYSFYSNDTSIIPIKSTYLQSASHFSINLAYVFTTFKNKQRRK